MNDQIFNVYLAVKMLSTDELRELVREIRTVGRVESFNKNQFSDLMQMLLDMDTGLLANKYIHLRRAVMIEVFDRVADDKL